MKKKVLKVDENQKFDEIIKVGLEKLFKRSPRIAILLGKEEYEKEVESGTADHIVENLKWFTKWLDKLKHLDLKKLNFENQISLKAMEYYHNINLFMHDAFPLWKKYPNGLAYFQETSFLLFQRKGPTTSAAESIIAHITHLPKYLEEFQSRFNNSLIPIIWRDLALEQIQTTPDFLKSLAEAFNKTTNITVALKNDLLDAFKQCEMVVQSHIEWIKSLPVENDEFAWALGSEKFDKLLSLRKLPWDRNTLIKDATRIFNTSLKKTKELLKEIYPTKTFGEAIEDFFKDDLIPNFEEVLLHAQNEAIRAKKFIGMHNLATIPQETLDIIETPPFLIPIFANAGYFDVPYFQKEQPGIYIISPTQMERNSYTMISYTMIHETYPGHHLDFTCNNYFASIIRRSFMNQTECPITACETTEGWALYCEEMMIQQGFFKAPIKAQQLNLGMQIQYAMNVILDIQLQCKQRSIEDAIKMLMNILQLNETVAKAAVLGWTTTPSYPLSYLVGKLLIYDLRREAEEKMGKKFSLKFFHDTILRSGDLPYFLLKEYFEEKIKNL